jgi:hypothetical protein
MLLGLWVSVLLGHAKVHHMNNVRSLGVWSTNQEVVWLDISVDEILLVDSLDSGKLEVVRNANFEVRRDLTICLATMTTVLVVNLRLQ